MSSWATITAARNACVRAGEIAIHANGHIVTEWLGERPRG
jgi:hypothetical protein